MADDPILIARLHRATFQGGNDEVEIVPDPQAEPDAVKYRGGAVLSTVFGWLLAHSHNVYEWAGGVLRRYEKGLDGVRHDDDYAKHVEAFEYVWLLHNPGERGDMGQRQEVMRCTHRGFYVFGKLIASRENVPDVMRQGIIDLYRALLLRDPESEAVIETWRTGSGGNLDVVRQGILGSPEYQALHPTPE